MGPRWQSWAKGTGIGLTFAAAIVFVIAAHWSRHPVPRLDPPATGNIERIPAEASVAPRSAEAAPAGRPLLIPVVGVRREYLVDTFTQARASDVRSHDAIDILAPRGTAVIAAASGTVEKLFLSRDGGNTVYVRSPDGRRLYYYAHLDRYAPSLAEGAALRQGAPIGTVGSTGNADPAAPHLHFAIWSTSPERKWWEEAAPINPFPLLEETGR